MMMNMKQPIIYLALMLLASGDIASAQTSSLYNAKGQLLADTSFRVSPMQAEMFAKVETQLLDCITQELVYPMPLWQIGVETNVIISFSIDPNGFMNDFRLENPQGTNDERLVSQYLLKKLIDCNFRYTGFRGSSKRSDIFHLPFHLDLMNGEIARIEAGWIFVPTPKP